jgi:hypothetical protein
MLRPILHAYKGNKVFTVNPQYSNRRGRMTPVSHLARERRCGGDGSRAQRGFLPVFREA